MSVDFAEQQQVWEMLPVDGVAYMNVRELAALNDNELQALIAQMEHNRYADWRNYDGLWRRSLGLDSTHDKTVLDFGCGTGLEALQFARAGNRVMIADITEAGRRIAERVLKLFGYEVESLPIRGDWPFVTPSAPVDVFYSNGVLHHTPEMPAILEQAKELLAPGGEIRLMLYTDRGWRLATESDPPDLRGSELEKHPDYKPFVIFFDGLGNYAEPWWPDKLIRELPGLQLIDWTYITEDGRYGVAILRGA
jgi:SAM-dependent methyltransferase